MRTPAQADLKRWSDDVARDPRSLAFLPLARAYRRRGMSEEAMKLCLRGLEAYPNNIEAHALLAMLYLDRGDHQKAADEWSIVLRLDPDNFEALRGLGFASLEQDMLSRARQLLERAALQRPRDTTVQEALRLLGTRQELAIRGLGARPALTAEEAEWAHELPPRAGRATTERPTAGRGDPGAGPDPAGGHVSEHGHEAAAPEFGEWFGHAGPPRMELVEHVPAAGREATRNAAAAEDLSPNPERLFDDLLAAGPVVGALFVDPHGLVIAGRMTGANGAAAAVLGAVVGGAAGEAARTAGHLALGSWLGIHMEADEALLHLVPAGSAGLVVLAARGTTPAGWLRRAAVHAAERAQRFLEVYG
jgi:tetratricopeptide (TPR) repeat protein